MMPAKRKELLDALRGKEREADEKAKVFALFKTTSAAPSAHLPTFISPKKTSAVVIAEPQGHQFVRHINSGAVEIVVSDTIVKFLGRESIFLQVIMLLETRRMTRVDGSLVEVSMQVTINPKLNMVAGHCRLRNILPVASCAGKIVFGNSFLLHASLDVKDFRAENIQKLYLLDYADLKNDGTLPKLGKIGVKLLAQAPRFNFGIADFRHDSKLCSLVVDGDFWLKDGDEVNCKNVRIGESSDAELGNALEDAIFIWSKALCKALRPAFCDLVIPKRIFSGLRTMLILLSIFCRSKSNLRAKKARESSTAHLFV